MLLIRTPSPPNKIAGRAIAHGHSGVGQAPLDLCLAPEVGIRRAAAGVRYRDMHDPPYARPGRRLEQHPAVGHGRVVVDVAVREPHPVGVVEGVRAPQRLGEAGRVGEVQRPHVRYPCPPARVPDAR